MQEESFRDINKTALASRVAPNFSIIVVKVSLFELVASSSSLPFP